MNTYAITLKFENNFQTLHATALEIDTATVNVHNYGIINGQNYLLAVKHHQLNTVLDVTRITPYQLIFFDDKQNFIGCSASLGKPEHLFSIQTTAKYILLVPFNVKIECQNLEKLSIKTV